MVILRIETQLNIMCCMLMRMYICMICLCCLNNRRSFSLGNYTSAKGMC